MENINFSQNNKIEKNIKSENNINSKEQKENKLTDELGEKILSSSIEEIDTRDRIENKMIDDFKDSKDSQILNFLSNFRRTGELAMQKISSEIVHLFNSNSLMMKIRGKYVYNRSKQITKKINNIEDYNDVEDFSNFLKTVGSDFWEDIRSDKYCDSVLTNSAQAIYKIADASPEMTDMVLATWPKILSRDLLSGSRSRGDSNSIIDFSSSSLSKILERENKLNLQDKEDIFDIEDDFLALFCMHKNDLYSSAKANFDNEVFKRLDSIIEKNPGLKNIPNKILRLIFDVALIRPDEILSNRRRQDFLYNLALNDAEITGHTDLLEEVMPLFVNSNYLNECPEGLRKKINSNILDYYNQCYATGNFRSIMLFLPFNEKEEEEMEKFKKDSGAYNLAIIKKEIIKNGKISEEEISNLGEIVEGRHSLVFLSWLIKEFPGGEGDENALGKIIDNIFVNSHDDVFDIKSLSAFSALLNKYNWPESLKRKIYQKNKLYTQELDTIFDTENKENSHYNWVENDPILLDEVRKNFYENSSSNNFRHYFFKVLDGEINVENLDDLINAHANRDSFNGFDIETLFIKYKIDKKYIPLFFDKIWDQDNILNSFVEADESGRITHEDSIFLIESLVKYGPSSSALMAFEYLDKKNHFVKENNDVDTEKRSELFNSYKDNILKRLPSIYISDVDKFLFSSRNYFLDDEELTSLKRGMLEESLSFSDLSLVALLNKKVIGGIDKIFPEKEKKEEYFKNLFEKVLKDKEFSGDKDLISTYFSNKEAFSFLDQKYLKSFEDKIFDKNIEFKAQNIFSEVESMDDKQKKLLLKKFEKYNFTEGIKNRDLINITKDAERLLSIDGSFFSIIFEKILNSEFIDYSIVEELDKRMIFQNFPVIRKAFIKNLERFKDINGFNILDSMKSDDDLNKSLLNKEEVKNISTLTIKNHGLSFTFWQGCLKSDPKNPAFYMDEDLFKTAIKNINLKGLNGSEIIPFFRSIENGVFPIDEEEKISIFRKILAERKSAGVYTDLFNHNQDVFESAVFEGVSKNENIAVLFEMGVSFSSKINEEILNYLALNNFGNKLLLNDFCNHFTRENDLEMIEKLKKHISNIEDEKKYQCQEVLLKYDLLTVEESKEMYKKMVSTENDVRKKILNTVKIVSSMLSNEGNVSKLENFFSEKSNPESLASLESISSFILKYKKEDKGRTIATIIFAKEYLPEKSLEDVVIRVSSRLKKYEKILENNSYNNIPNNIKASVGMEYEITSSTANGYKELTGRYFKDDILDLSESCKIGFGKDAVHEIATRPTDNPYLMILEMKLLHDTEYIDLNFDRSEEYQKGARGFHLTLGGEKGLKVNQNTQFLQNAILLSSWGGVLSGETGKKVNGGRGVSLRLRDSNAFNNVKFFDKATDAVELRSLAIDKEEGLQRSVLTAFNGAIAIQAFEKCCLLKHSEVLEKIKTDEGLSDIKKAIFEANTDNKTKEIATLWLKLVENMIKVVEDHNTSFMERETSGYFDEKGDFIEVSDFNGEYNKKRFEEIIRGIDPTLSLEEYLKTTNIDEKDLFSEFSVSFSDKIIKINNLFLKPGVESTTKDGKRETIIKGDMINAFSALSTTKLEDGNFETYDEDFLRSSIFDKAGERRKGYYYFQGGSEKMITHAVQRALLEFNSKVEDLVK